MTAKKTPFKKPATKKTAKATPAPILTDKEKVKKQVKDAECFKQKKGLYNICLKSQRGHIIPLHSGLAKTESDAWKLAAHAVI